MLNGICRSSDCNVNECLTEAIFTHGANKGMEHSWVKQELTNKYKVRPTPTQNNFTLMETLGKTGKLVQDIQTLKA